MNGSQNLAERSIATFLIGALALSPPILSIFSAGIFILGIPLLYLYLFAVWTVLIVLVAWFADWGVRDKPSQGGIAEGQGREDR